MGQRLVVWVMVGGVAGFGAVFLQLPGIVFALVGLLVLIGTLRASEDLLRVGGYLVGAGLVGWSLVGPAVAGAGGFLFVSGWALVTAYALVAGAGCLIVGGLAVRGIRRRKRAP